MPRLDLWGINERIILQNYDNVKNIITSKFKKNLWENKEQEGKMKYYIINRWSIPIWKTKIIFVLTSVKKKIGIAKIRTKLH